MGNANPSTAPLFIMNPFSGRDVLVLFGTHPPVRVGYAIREHGRRKIERR
jgi:hypothetical protein